MVQNIVFFFNACQYYVRASLWIANYHFWYTNCPMSILLL